MRTYYNSHPLSAAPPAPAGLPLFFAAPATTDIYPLSLHDALPISPPPAASRPPEFTPPLPLVEPAPTAQPRGAGEEVRSEEHTSELQSQLHPLCRLPPAAPLTAADVPLPTMPQAEVAAAHAALQPR